MIKHIVFILLIVLGLGLGQGRGLGEAPKFTYVPAQQVAYWVPPPEFVAPAETWKPPAGYEEYAQPWNPPTGWEQPEKWLPPPEPEGFEIEIRKIPGPER